MENKRFKREKRQLDKAQLESPPLPSDMLDKGISNVMFVTLGLYYAVSWVIFTLVNAAQPVAYMDEVFHAPQTMKFCNGTWNEWDPKITTLPGTYVIAAGMLMWPERLGIASCSINFLRGVNLVFSGLNLVLIHQILGFYMPTMSPAKRAFAAINIATFPVLYFFSFLYYTDTISTFFLLQMHLFNLEGNYGRAAFAGGFAVCTRQTNIIWVFWHGVLNVYDMAKQLLVDYCREGNALYGNTGSRARVLKSKSGKKVKRNVDVPKIIFPPVCGNTLRLIFKMMLNRMLTLGKDIVNRTIGYVIVGLLFGAFVLINGSIVVGDKDAHQVAVNFPQMGYFTLVYGTFCFPFIFRRLISTVIVIGSNLRYFTLAILFFWLVAHCNTVAHPYLLADNRHYTFYVWKNLYQACPWMQIILCPAYVFIWSSLLNSMNVQFKYKISFVICCALNLVPQSLLEFRYFIPAYLFARLPMANVRGEELLLEFFIHLAFNTFTLYKFVYFSFSWPNSDEKQRFMW